MGPLPPVRVVPGTSRPPGRTGIRLASPVALVVALVASLLFAAPPAAAQLPCDFVSEFAYRGYATVSRPPRYEIGRQEVLSIPSRIDGAAIQIGIVRPEVPAGTRVPVIVDASPYYHPLQTLDLRACRPHLTENFVPQGYAVALVAVRGTADSGVAWICSAPGSVATWIRRSAGWGPGTGAAARSG